MSHDKKTFNDDDRRDWLRLMRSENVGPATFWKLLDHFGTAKKALAAIPDMAHQGGKTKHIRICTDPEIDTEFHQARKLGAKFIFACEDLYPSSLKAIIPPPPVICVRGNLDVLFQQLIAIVGARNASASGRKLAKDLANDLGNAGLVVVSGLARGIDTAAHQGALDTGTIAVLAGGVDCVYPPENKDLYGAISTKGLVVSEQPIKYVAQGRDFPKRNRIVSGLSLGVIIVEAGLRSGSLITANFAADQGREVYAVPGSPLDPRAKGPNRLIRDGATLIETAEHVLQALTPIATLRHPQHKPLEPSAPDENGLPPADETELSVARRKLTALLGPTPTPIDDLIRMGEATPAAVHHILLELELAGRLERHPGAKVSRLGR